jgi:hypothetical protein
MHYNYIESDQFLRNRWTGSVLLGQRLPADHPTTSRSYRPSPPYTMPGCSAASPNIADNLRKAAVQSLLKVEPDFISTGNNRLPLGTSKSTSCPALSRQKYSSATCPALNWRLTHSDTTSVSNSMPREACVASDSASRIPSNMPSGRYQENTEQLGTYRTIGDRPRFIFNSAKLSRSNQPRIDHNQSFDARKIFPVAGCDR